MSKIALLVMALLTTTLGGVFVVQHQNKASSMTDQSAVLQQVSQHLAATPAVRLKSVDCKVFYLEDVSQDTHCFVSPVLPDDLHPLLATSAHQLGSTPGWSQDYGVWGAFYTLTGNPKRTFGVTIKAIADSKDFEGVKEVQGYKSFVSVTVNPKPNP